MNKKEIIVTTTGIILMIIDLYLYLEDPIDKGLKMPILLFFVFVTLAVFYRNIWTKLLFTVLLLFFAIAYYFGITLF